MDDPWATPWGSSSKDSSKDALRSMSMSPPPEDLDVSDPWAPTKSKAAAAAASGQAAGAAALSSAKDGFGAARERMAGVTLDDVGGGLSRGISSAGAGIKSMTSGARMPTSDEMSSGFSSVRDGVSSGFNAVNAKMRSDEVSAGFSSVRDGVSSGFSTMSAKMPSSEEVSAGFGSMRAKMPDMDGVSAGFSSGLSSMKSMGSKMSMPDMSGMKMPSMPSSDMPGMSGMKSGFSSMTSGFGGFGSSSSPPAVPEVEAPAFSVPSSITSSLSSFQSKAQGAATTALAGHLASQAPPTMPSALSNYASHAIAGHMTSQASAAITARATAATANATASANAYTSGLSSTLNSNITSLNSNISALSSAANTASSFAASAGPMVGGLGGMPSMPSMPALPSFGDAWRSPPEAKAEVRPPTPVRSPSPPAFGDVWGAPEKEERSVSPAASVHSASHHSASQSPSRSMASSPRKSLEARLSRELSRNLSFERRASGSRPSSPLKEAAVPLEIPDLAIAAATPVAATTSFATFGETDEADLSTTSLGIVAPDTSLRRTPSFGSSFGGFNDGDAWGSGAGAAAEGAGDDWGTSDSYGGAAETYDSWGGVRTSTPPTEPTAQEQQWVAAQRAIQIKEERVPFDKMQALKREWDAVAASVIPESAQLETMDEEVEAKLDAGVKELEEKVNETLRSLTVLPDTRIPPLHTLTTHQKYTAALARANPNPSTSLLHMPIRPRRLEGLSFGPGLEGTWGGRSRLGEPDAEIAAAAAAEDAPSRWSFWKKAPAQKPLVTSGGGMLEVKTPTLSSPQLPDASADLMAAAAAATAASAAAAATATATAAAATSAAASATASAAASARPSFSAHPSMSSLPGSISRPASIAPSGTASPPVPSPAPAPVEDSGHAAPRHSLAEDAQPAQPPTGVSRFFGRWGRRSTTPSAEVQQQQTVDEDIELTSDDFAFLSEVPSMPTAYTHGTGDLLGFGGGPPTVETVLAPSSSPKLPSPINPPSGGRSTPTRQSSGFVARMAPPTAKVVPTQMDLLSGLDFDAPPSAAPSQPPQSSSVLDWDEFLAPSKPSSSRATPSIAPPPRTATPPIIAPPPGRTATPPIISPPPTRSPPAVAPARTATPPMIPAPPQRTRSPPTTSPMTSSPLTSSTSLNMGSMASTLPSMSSAMSPMVPRTSSPMGAPMIPGPPRAGTPQSNRPTSPPTLAFEPLAPTSSWQSQNTRQSTSPLSAVMSPSAPLMQTLSGASSPAATGIPLLSPPQSAKPLNSPASPDTSFASFGMNSLNNSMNAGNTSMAPLMPSGLATPLNLSVRSPGASAPLLPAQPPRTPKQTEDDFGDFDDFADFSTNNNNSTFDDFGDFGDFSSFDSPAPPLPSKSSPMPPKWSAPPAWNKGSPAPTPPSKSPYAPGTRTVPPVVSPTRKKMGSGSVDHTPTLTLMTSANRSPGRWPSPASPVAPTIPPPGRIAPPPGGRKRAPVDLLDLMDDM